MPKDCPKCRLVNPDDAQRCDCGWDFASGRQERSYLVHKPVQTIGIGIGVFLAVAFFIRLAMRVFF